MSSKLMKARKQSNKLDSSLKSVTRTTTRLFASLGAFASVTGVAKLGLDLEQTKIKFETLLGSSAKATKMINDLNKFANVTPFENADLNKNAELLLNFGIANQKILPTLKMIGDVSGGNKDKLNSLTLAYAQVSSTGKLMGQDLLQMINAGFNPLQIISEKTGKSMKSLKDAMSQGKISAKHVEEAFKIATSKGGRFYGMMEKISTSGWGRISTFLGSLKLRLAELGEKYLVPIINKVVDFGIKFVAGFKKIEAAVIRVVNIAKPAFSAIFDLIGAVFGFSQANMNASSAVDIVVQAINSFSVVIEILSLGIQKVVSFLTPLAPILKVIAIGYGVWTAAQWALNIAMTANPIGLIITGIVALVGSITYAYQKIGWFRGAINAIWETLKGFAEMLKNLVINRIKEMISGIVGIGKTLMLFFKGEWSKAWEVGKQATKDLMGVGSAQKAIADAKKLGKNVANAYRTGVKQTKGSTVLNKIKKNKSIKDDIVGAGNGDGTNTLGDSSAFNDGLKGITEGGKKQTNIHVTIGKMVETLEIRSQNITESYEEMEDKLKEVLLRVLNSSNQMQTS